MTTIITIDNFKTEKFSTLLNSTSLYGGDVNVWFCKNAVINPVGFTSTRFDVFGIVLESDEPCVLIIEHTGKRTAQIKTFVQNFYSNNKVNYYDYFLKEIVDKYGPLSIMHVVTLGYLYTTAKDIFDSFDTVLSYAYEHVTKVYLTVDTCMPGVDYQNFGNHIDKATGHLTLNISPEAIGGLSINQETETLSFSCRLQGREQRIKLPLTSVVAVYAPVDGQVYYDRQSFMNVDENLFSGRVVTSDQPQTEKPKRPAFQVIDGGKS